MSRVKRGTSHLKRRRNLLRHAKGYRWGRKSKIRLAKTAITKAGVYAYRDRRAKKRVMRRLWTVKLNAALRQEGLTYSTFINQLKKSRVSLNRKMLSQLAEEYPTVFTSLTRNVK